jgi:hypothetical protein
MLLLTAVVLVGSFITARWVDKRNIQSLGFHFDRQWWKDLLFGALLGALLMLFIFLTEFAFGWIKITGFYAASSVLPNFEIGLLIYVLQFICVGIYEETFSRGYQLINLAEGFSFLKNPKTGLLVAYIITSSVFGVMHAFNPGATLTSVVNLMVAGLFLGLGMVLTGRIGLSIGLHITLEFFSGQYFWVPCQRYANRCFNHRNHSKRQ